MFNDVEDTKSMSRIHVSVIQNPPLNFVCRLVSTATPDSDVVSATVTSLEMKVLLDCRQVFQKITFTKYNCFFAETCPATTHQRDIILYVAWKRRTWVIAGS